MIQAQFVETMVLLTINHQTLIATKASRITARAGRTVLEFGSRRAQGLRRRDLWRARRLYRRLSGTACVLADRDYKIPAGGTMAHSSGADVRQRIRGVRPMRTFIRTTASFWSTPITSSNPAFRTIRVARDMVSEYGSARAASVWIRAISPTFRSRRVKC